jgi:hypothetical protein
VLLIGFIVPGLSYALRKPSWRSSEVTEEDDASAAATETPTTPETPTSPAAAPAGMAASAAMPLQGGGDEEAVGEPMATEPATPPPPTPPSFDPEHQPTPDNPKRRKLIYAAAGFVVGAAVVAGLAAFESGRDDEEAQGKADEVIESFQQAGYRAPERDLIVNLLGSDGGNVCEDPSSTLQQALHKQQQLANGAAQVGLRPVIADEDVVQGQLLILDVYCPDKAEEVRAYLEDLKYDDVVHP